MNLNRILTIVFGLAVVGCSSTVGFERPRDQVADICNPEVLLARGAPSTGTYLWTFSSSHITRETVVESYTYVTPPQTNILLQKSIEVMGPIKIGEIPYRSGYYVNAQALRLKTINGSVVSCITSQDQDFPLAQNSVKGGRALLVFSEPGDYEVNETLLGTVSGRSQGVPDEIIPHLRTMFKNLLWVVLKQVLETSQTATYRHIYIVVNREWKSGESLKRGLFRGLETASKNHSAFDVILAAHGTNGKMLMGKDADLSSGELLNFFKSSQYNPATLRAVFMTLCNSGLRGWDGSPAMGEAIKLGNQKAILYEHLGYNFLPFEKDMIAFKYWMLGYDFESSTRAASAFAGSVLPVKAVPWGTSSYMVHVKSNPSVMGRGCVKVCALICVSVCENKQVDFEPTYLHTWEYLRSMPLLSRSSLGNYSFKVRNISVIPYDGGTGGT